MNVTISRVPWVVRVFVPTLLYAPQWTIGLWVATQPHMPSPTLWSLIGAPATAAALGAAVLSVPRLTAGSSGIRFWFRRIPWQSLTCVRRRWLTVECLEFTIGGSRGVERVPLNVRGAHAFVETVSRYCVVEDRV
jgi:hypothetical protein